MANPTFRLMLFTLIACGLAGALLYAVQPAPKRAPPIPSAAATPRPHHHPAAHTPISADPDAAAFARALSSYTVRTSSPSRPAPASTQTAAVSAPADPEDLDLNDPALRLPLARFALAYVGTDELAEALWLHAINDLDLSPEDRKNLIEDLNEDGFPDPGNLTRDDLPLIEARLALIDSLAPDAMDDTNAAAFEEARKDLVEMRARLVPPAEPAPAAAPTQSQAEPAPATP